MKIKILWICHFSNKKINSYLSNKNYKELFGDQSSQLLSIYEHEHNRNHSTDGKMLKETK